jgi:ribulose kinase
MGGALDLCIIQLLRHKRAMFRRDDEDVEGVAVAATCSLLVVDI